MKRKKKTSLESLIGFQILYMDEEHIVVAKDNQIAVIDIKNEDGGCCGYNIIEAICEYNYGDKNNPIITKVEKLVDENGDSEICEITFFGESKAIAYIETTSTSGSGWGYGATVSITCSTLNINEILSSW